jgi:small subunit ribosomal protein S8
MVNDPVADMLTRIRNATMARHRHVAMPGSKIRRRIAEILKEEGFVEDYKWTEDAKQGVLHIELRYDDRGTCVIEGLRRLSRPGRRNYAGSESIPRIRSGLGIVIVSTSHGVMTGRDARAKGIGGEVLCAVW